MLADAFTARGQHRDEALSTARLRYRVSAVSRGLVLGRRVVPGRAWGALGRPDAKAACRHEIIHGKGFKQSRQTVRAWSEATTPAA